MTSILVLASHSTRSTSREVTGWILPPFAAASASTHMPIIGAAFFTAAMARGSISTSSSSASRIGVCSSASSSARMRSLCGPARRAGKRWPVASCHASLRLQWTAVWYLWPPAGVSSGALRHSGHARRHGSPATALQCGQSTSTTERSTSIQRPRSFGTRTNTMDGSTP